MSEVNSLKKWKEKREKTVSKKFQKGAKMFSKRRKWRDEVEEIKELEKSYGEFDASKVGSFSDFPLSNKTKRGLEKGGYTSPTAIQKASIMPALTGRDVLGAAKTGSGKTLAFLIPVMECLFRQRWTSFAGPGALIISPTRELAYQTFEVLKKVGSFHDFSAGLVIGGKDVKSEAAHMSRTNILICTPGRLLQHMDQTSFFDVSGLQMLVLDEADRILDLGFKATLNAILENMPQEKQTLLFSATQTKSVKDLARLSLKDPAYIAVHEKSKTSTPSGLNQKYVVCKLQDKFNMLYSFVKTHLKTKTLVFLSACKQVQYFEAAFRKLRPGVPVMMLHGKMNQIKRMAVYDEFSRKKFALLFCTDIAARGLDFPTVDWVVQLDCPEDAETYIHRAGRTARYHGHGHALLVLLENEETAMVQQLEAKKVPITKTEINSEKFFDVNSRLESYCAEDMELKEKAQRCFVSYIRSVFLMKNKSVFSVQSLPLADFSASLGLAVTPRVRFLQRHQANKARTSLIKPSLDENKNIDVEEEGKSNSEFSGTSNAGELGAMFSVKRKDVFNVEASDTQEVPEVEISTIQSKKAKKTLTKAANAKKLLKKKYKCNQKIVFDDEGELAEAWPPMDSEDYKAIHEGGEAEVLDGINIEKSKSMMQERDISDRQRHREKIKTKHREKRLKDKEQRRQLQAAKEGRSYNKEGGEEVVAILGSPGDEDSGEDADSNASNERKRDVKIEYSVSDDESFSDDENILSKRLKLQAADRDNNTFSDLISDAGLSLQEEENLAMQLLGKR